MNSKETMFSLARDLVTSRQKKTGFEDKVKVLDKEIETLISKLLEIMQSEDLQNFSMNGRTFSQRIDSFPKVIDKDRLYQFLKNHKEESLMQMNVNAQTLRAWYKEKGIQWEEELKDGILEIPEKMKIAINPKP